LNELNDASAPIPAYMRFQRQDQDACFLRDDLKKLKADYFKGNYEKELNVPASHLEDVHFKGGNLDGLKYF